ncbi:uncharacterized protein TrAFT101_004747 [Trichoderma asperellum]|uniref:uncharacterized protein n=1 Tax=Trichoderma asperellum TaxID=101201 RepID=UPI003331C2AE|nr:hypothetical protein TrAFT101_004747 [Trichoderma asperellum]
MPVQATSSADFAIRALHHDLTLRQETIFPHLVDPITYLENEYCSSSSPKPLHSVPM